MRSNRLKQLWREERTAFGMWADLGSPAAVEAMAQLDLDWILLDGEHGAASYEGIYGLMQAMNGSQATVVVRVPSNNQPAIKRVLDMGAEAILVPYIFNAEEVEGIVRACRFPPVGIRGLGAFRGSRYETDQDYYRRANDEIAVMVQIECVAAAQDLDRILAVPGLDSIFIGPSDLAASMGHFLDNGHPEVQAEIARILKAAQKVGMPVGIWANTGEEAKQRAAEGYRWVNVGCDMMMLANQTAKELKAARGK